MTTSDHSSSRFASDDAPTARIEHERGDGIRPFGAHMQMAWWKPLLIMLGLPLAMVLLQIALYAVAALIEGDGGGPNVITPLQFLAINLSMGITGLLSVPLIARAARLPWRAVLSFPRQWDSRRLVLYLGVSLLVVAAGNAVLAVVAPDTIGWTTFGVSGVTVVLLAAVVLTTPLQAAAEELMFRGAIMPAVASWARSVRPALVLGVAISSPVFAIVHGSTDPWLFSYYTFLGVCFAVMAVISRGLEAPIALHVVNNTLTMILNALFIGGGDFTLDRSAGAGGPHLLIPTFFILISVGVVWVIERRRERIGSTRG